MAGMNGEESGGPPCEGGLSDKFSKGAMEKTPEPVVSFLRPKKIPGPFISPTVLTVIHSECPCQQLAGRRWGRNWRSGHELARLRTGGE